MEFEFTACQDALKILLWWQLFGWLNWNWLASKWPRISARFFTILVIVFGFDLALTSFLRIFFGSMPQPSVIAESIANTNWQESWNFILSYQSQIVFAIMCLALLGAGAHYLSKDWQRLAENNESALLHYPRFAKWLKYLVTLIFFLLHANPSMLRQEPFLRLSVLYFRHMNAEHEIGKIKFDRDRILQNKKSWGLEANSISYSSRFGHNKTNKHTLVLFIGESANPSLWSLYGYQRPTTTALTNLLSTANGQAYIFNNAYSTEAFTLPSLRLGLTPATLELSSLSHSAPDIVMLAQALGYHVSWISNQPKGEGWFAALAQSSNYSKFINNGNWRDSSSYDRDLIPELQQLITKPNKGKELIIVHLLGQHFHYALRCPADEKFFSSGSYATSGDLVDAQLLREGRSDSLVKERRAYDDATRCGTNALASMMENVMRARNQEALDIVYFSDHGQEVGENGDTTGHTTTYPSGYRVPAFLWRSVNSNSDIVSATQLTSHSQASTKFPSQIEAAGRPKSPKLLRIDKPYRVDFIDELLLKLMGAHTKWYSEKNDILSKTYQPPTGAIDKRITAGIVGTFPETN